MPKAFYEPYKSYPCAVSRAMGCKAVGLPRRE